MEDKDKIVREIIDHLQKNYFHVIGGLQKFPDMINYLTNHPAVRFESLKDVSEMQDVFRFLVDDVIVFETRSNFPAWNYKGETV